MFTRTWPHCIGQARIKEVLEAAIANNSLGHAYLFSGDEGSGKFAAALDLALGLLCEGSGARPCMACPSCRKVMDYAHPDFHIIMPVVLDKEHKGSDGDLSAKGWEFVGNEAKKRIDEPYLAIDHEKAPTIPVDWIREVNHTIQGGARGAGMNVAILDGVDRLNTESANSMLKLLEEPPAGTVLLLLTDRLSEVLPTIASRCQMLRFAWLLPAEIREGLKRRFGAKADGADKSLFETGSLGKSIALFANPPVEVRADAEAFLDLCGQGDWTAIAPRIDELVEWKDLDRYEKFFGAVVELAREGYLHGLPPIENVFLSGREHAPGRAFSHEEVGRVLDLCGKSIAAVRGYANMMLVLSTFAIALVEVLRAQKQ
jgi:hypothetical protein